MRNYSRPLLQSAERTLRVVQLLAQRGRATLTEVARELGIAPSMAHRLLVTCCELDFARQEGSGGAYEAGPALHELSLGLTRAVALRDAGAAQLAKACNELRETVSVVVLEGRDIRFVETLEPDRTMRVTRPIGRTMPAHTTAGGRVMLAYLPPEELERRFPARTLTHTPQPTIANWDDLLTELERIRTRGWGIQIDEDENDVVALGYPILDGLGQPRAALVVSAPRSRVATSRDAQAIATMLEAHAHKIRRRLRGSH